ncbi:hypothetical protein SSS_05451 [Sarcoptes scabiei]|nr:hypothetical protein SSS_05451 [Sarcoptes scabiei]
MKNLKGPNKMEQEINLDEIVDMNLLQNLLDQTEDIDDRKAIRSRIQELRAIERVSGYKPTKAESNATFSMSGGVPKVSKGSQPGTPISPGFPGGLNFPKAAAREDPAQEIIKQRQREAEEDKKRLLRAYDYVSRQGAGPKQVVLEELKRFDV